MKLITVIIQPDKLDEVREALVAADITRITVQRVAGHGRQAAEEIYRGQIVAPNLLPKVRIDIACNENFVKPACDAILKAARHNGGKIGDGKIFISSLDEVIRIRTGEIGGDAI